MVPDTPAFPPATTPATSVAWDGKGCIKQDSCPAGYYCTGGSSIPQACPTGSTSAAGSSSLGDCKCSSGNYLSAAYVAAPAGGTETVVTCSTCTENHYCLGGTSVTSTTVDTPSATNNKYHTCPAGTDTRGDTGKSADTGCTSCLTSTSSGLGTYGNGNWSAAGGVARRAMRVSLTLLIRFPHVVSQANVLVSLIIVLELVAHQEKGSGGIMQAILLLLLVIHYLVMTLLPAYVVKMPVLRGV